MSCWSQVTTCTSRLGSTRKLLQVKGVVAQVLQGLLALGTVSSTLVEARLDGQLGYEQSTSDALIEGLLIEGGLWPYFDDGILTKL